MAKASASKDNGKCTESLPVKNRALSNLGVNDIWYKAIIHSFPDGLLLIKHPGGDILDVNDAFCHMMGYTREELLSMNIRDIEVGFDETSEAIPGRYSDSKETGETAFETCHKLSGGKIIDVSVHLRYLEEGLFLCFYRDITQQKKKQEKELRNLKQAKEALKETEDRYRTLIELGTKIGEAVIMLQDIDGREGIHTYVSDQWIEISGYSRQELLEMSFFDLVSSKDKNISIKRHRQKVTGKTIPDLFELAIIHKEGKEIPVEITSAATCYQGKPTNVVYIRDITDRKITEKRLKEYQQHLEELVEKRTNETIRHMHEYKQTKEQLQFIIDTVPAYIGYKDKELLYQFVNQAIVDKSGIPRQKQLGKSVQEIHPDNPKLCDDEIIDDLKVLHTGLPDIQVSRYKYKGAEEVWVERSRVPHKGDDSEIKGLVILTIDITKQKQAELKIKSLYRKESILRHRLETEMKQRVEFMRAIVHELKTPLTPLLAASDEMLGITEKGKFLSCAKRINAGTLDLSRRIDELMDLSQGELGLLRLNYSDFDVYKVIQDITGRFSAQTSKYNQKIVINPPAGCFPVQADKDRITQVVFNLLDNALKFTRRQGKIDIWLEPKHEGTIIQVQDYGQGIDPELCDVLFDRDKRTKIQHEHTGGLGLGLGLCKLFIELHGGKIWIDSKPGEGSTFSFCIPDTKSNLKEAA